MCLIFPPHTHTHSVVYSVCRLAPPPEYAVKAVGSLVLTHFHNLVYRGREGEWETAREESFSSLRLLLLSAKRQSLAVIAREEDGG